MIKSIIQNYFINVDKKGFKTYFKFKILFIKLAGTIKKILFKSIKTIFIFLTTIFLTSGFAADKNYDLSTVSNTNKQKSTKFDYLNDAFDGAKDLDVDYKSSIKKRYPSYMGDKFSFDSLLEFTLLNSPGINLAKIDVLSALNEFDYARANYYPELGISANTEYSKRFDSGVNSVYIGNDSLSSQTTYSNSLSLVLRYDLFKFGADYYAAEAARENITNTRYKKCVYELNTSLNLLESYYEVLMYKNRVDIYEKLKNLYKMLYNYQKRLLKAGEIDKLALANSAISLADTSYELEELWLNANNSLSKLNAISGAKVKDISLLDDFGLNDTNLGFNKFEDTIIAKQFDYELMQNELALKAEEKSYYPTISFYARYDLYGSDMDSYRASQKDLEKHGYRVGLSFYMSLFDGGKRDTKVKEKEINKNRILLKKEEAKLEYEKDIADLSLYLGNKDRIENILKELQTLSNDTHSMQQRLNQSGENSKIDVLNAIIIALKKELDYKEHIIKTGYNATKANLLLRNWCGE